VSKIPVRIENPEFRALIGQTNFIQRLLYIPYCVFTCALIGIFISLPICVILLFLPIDYRESYIAILIALGAILYPSFSSPIYVYSKRYIDLSSILLGNAVFIVVLLIATPEFIGDIDPRQIVHSMGILIFVSIQNYLPLVGIIIFIGLWFKLIEKSSTKLSEVSQM
jgi:hypothetical protein